MAESHLSLLTEMIALLERYSREVTRAQLDADRETWLKVRGALEVAAQCCIDLALFLISRRGLGLPQSYREAFSSLARAGMISAELASQLSDWAGLRNVLVHVYTDLDLERIHRALGESAPLVEFRSIVARELTRE